MNTTTWPFGTRKTVTIEFTMRRKEFYVLAIEIEAENPEGFILIGDKHAVEPVKGAVCIMEFCEGGPMGGHRKLIENRQNAPKPTRNAKKTA